MSWLGKWASKEVPHWAIKGVASNNPWPFPKCYAAHGHTDLALKHTRPTSQSISAYSACSMLVVWHLGNSPRHSLRAPPWLRDYIKNLENKKPKNICQIIKSGLLTPSCESIRHHDIIIKNNNNHIKNNNNKTSFPSPMLIWHYTWEGKRYGLTHTNEKDLWSYTFSPLLFRLYPTACALVQLHSFHFKFLKWNALAIAVILRTYLQLKSNEYPVKECLTK